MSLIGRAVVVENKFGVEGKERGVRENGHGGGGVFEKECVSTGTVI